MGKMFLNVSGWFLRKFGLLLLLVAALSLAPSVIEVWKLVEEFDTATTARTIKKQVDAAVPRKGAPKEEIERQRKVLQAQLERKKTERETLNGQSCYLPTCRMVTDAKLYQIDLEIELIEQALAYAGSISEGTKPCDDRNRSSRRLYELAVSDAELESGRPVWAPRVQAHLDLKARIHDFYRLQMAQEKLCLTYQRLSNAFEANQNAVQQKLEREYGGFLANLDEKRQLRFAFLRTVMDVLPAALGVLLGIIFIPIGVKLFSYYGVATWASRRFGVRLVPEATGELSVASASHEIQRIELEKGWELLIDPALLRSSPDSAEKGTRYLLDWSMPLSSVASGQYLLTCIRGSGTVTISDEKDNLSKIAVLELPANAAVVLQPRCLAGIVQRTDQPIRISRPWRLGNIGSWLTLQLRYVIFHGPAKLIVSGSHGVAVDAAQAGSSVNQAATLGFSANLSYGVSRCETFYAYLSGKKELFNDCFSAGPGYYIHEVRARPVGTTLLPGRGIAGVINSVLKVFGL